MSSASKRSLPTRIFTPSTASIGRCLMRNSELPEKMFLSFTAGGRNWNKSEPNDSALRPMFNGRFAAANGAKKPFTPEREGFLIAQDAPVRKVPGFAKGRADFESRSNHLGTILHDA